MKFAMYNMYTYILLILFFLVSPYYVLGDAPSNPFADTPEPETAVQNPLEDGTSGAPAADSSEKPVNPEAAADEQDGQPEAQKESSDSAEPADAPKTAAEDGAEDAAKSESGAAEATEKADSQGVSQPEDEVKQDAENAEQPEVPENTNGIKKTSLKTGGYFSIVKIILLMVLYLLWIKTTDWASSDAVEFEKNWKKWNPILVGAFAGSFILTLFLPWFWVGYSGMVIAYLVPFILYVRYRNEDMNPADMVFTKDHIRHVIAEKVSKVGVKVDAVPKDKNTTGCAATLTSYTKSERQREVRRVQAHAHEGFMDARKMIAALMTNQPESAMLDFAPAGVSVRLLLDGVWHPGEPLERETADPALEALKVLCGMNPQDRRNKQTGECQVEFTYSYDFPDERLQVAQLQQQYDALLEEDDDEKYAQRRKLKEDLRKAKEALPPPESRVRKAVITVTSQGTQTGERVLLAFSAEKQNFSALADTGMRDKLAEQVQGMFNQEKGIMIFSAPAGNGLRTTFNLAMSKTDRYQREYFALEQESNQHDKIENVPVTTYTPDDTMKDVLKRFFLKEPQVAVIQDMTGDILDACFKEMSTDNRLIVTTVRAKDASEALLRMLILKDSLGTATSAEKLANSVNVVVCQRLIRKLCDHCKQKVQAPPALAQALGFPAGREVFLYQPPGKPAEDEQPCPECHGIGYKGRTAICEVMIVGDTIREVLKKAPKLELLRKASAKDGNRSLRDEGTLLVAKGITSLQELKRILEM